MEDSVKEINSMNAHRMWAKIIIQVADQGRKAVIESPKGKRVAVISGEDFELLEKVKAAAGTIDEKSNIDTYSIRPWEMTEEDKLQFIYENHQI